MQKHPSIESIMRTIAKLCVYQRDAEKLGDFLVANSLSQIVRQCEILRDEVERAIFRHDGQVPQYVAEIFSAGFTQIINQGEYLMELINLHEQAADERPTSISTKPQSVAASQALARPDSVNILFA
jgi:hypothetical protein